MDTGQKSRWAGKWGWLVFVLLVPAATSFGQESRGPSASNIEILKLHWEKQIQLPRNFDPSVIPTGGTFSDPASRTSTGPTATNPADAVRAATSARSAAAGSNPTTFPATPGRLPVSYIYSMKIRNANNKKIEGIAWDYVFMDPNSGAELGRHQFLSYVMAEPDKVVTLKGQM